MRIPWIVSAEHERWFFASQVVAQRLSTSALKFDLQRAVNIDAVFDTCRVASCALVLWQWSPTNSDKEQRLTEPFASTIRRLAQSSRVFQLVALPDSMPLGTPVTIEARCWFRELGVQHVISLVGELFEAEKYIARHCSKHTAVDRQSLTALQLMLPWQDEYVRLP